MFHEDCRHILQISEIEGFFNPKAAKQLGAPFFGTTCPGCGHAIQRVGWKVEEQEVQAGMRRVGILHLECKQMMFVGEIHHLNDKNELGEFVRPFRECLCPRCGQPVQGKISLIAEET